MPPAIAQGLVGRRPLPTPLVTMAAEARASPKLGFQEMYLCSELLALQALGSTPWGAGGLMRSGLCGEEARREPEPWALGSGLCRSPFWLPGTPWCGEPWPGGRHTGVGVSRAVGYVVHVVLCHSSVFGLLPGQSCRRVRWRAWT